MPGYVGFLLALAIIFVMAWIGYIGYRIFRIVKPKCIKLPIIKAHKEVIVKYISYSEMSGNSYTNAQQNQVVYTTIENEGYTSMISEANNFSTLNQLVPNNQVFTMMGHEEVDLIGNGGVRGTITQGDQDELLGVGNNTFDHLDLERDESY